MGIEVYKFGGASVKDAEGVKNATSIMQQKPKGMQLVVVVSAMGKTTNALEELLTTRLKSGDWYVKLAGIKYFHAQIIQALFANPKLILDGLDRYFVRLENALVQANEHSADKAYDSVIHFGEMLSTFIVFSYALQTGLEAKLIDARHLIKTDNTYREGKIQWEATQTAINEQLVPLLKESVAITQGFVGCSEEGFTTTLGREGSDFTASILANGLDAEAVTIWKDVPGVLNADPKLFNDTVLFPTLNYYDAAEMTFYGATVIHPKTIKPLADKDIPLKVKSFLDPNEPGTVIKSGEPQPVVPTLIVKKDQTLISFGVKDLSFVDELHIGSILKAFNSCNFKINIMQTSAVTFSVCVDTKEHLIQQVEAILKSQFNIHYNEKLTLITVKNYNLKTIESAIGDGKVLLEQRTRHTYQVIVQ